MEKRIKWIDIARGLLILLVILGHSRVNGIILNIINSFHMAAFFILSGITYRYEEIGIKEFFKKKIKTLIFPYIIFSLIMLSFFYLKKVVFLNYSFDFYSGIISIVLPISGKSTTSVYGLWFFPCLFITEILFYIILHLKKLKKNFF